MSRYRFIADHVALWSVIMMCAVLEVSRSGYYDWLNRRPSAKQLSDEALVAEIKAIHEAYPAYGSPRVHLELLDRGYACGENRVARLMAINGIVAIDSRRRKRTTESDGTDPKIADLVKRDFTADEPDQLYVGDITYVRTWAGWLYLATVIDVYSRRVIGWSIATHMRASLVSDALKTAAAARGGDITGAIFHSDRGSQYTSDEFGRVCDGLGVTQSMGRVGTCFDNAMAESWFSTFKREFVYLTAFPTVENARRRIFEWIETKYNRNRRHSAIGGCSPVEYERLYNKRHEQQAA